MSDAQYQDACCLDASKSEESRESGKRRLGYHYSYKHPVQHSRSLNSAIIKSLPHPSSCLLHRDGSDQYFHCARVRTRIRRIYKGSGPVETQKVSLVPIVYPDAIRVGLDEFHVRVIRGSLVK
jgi:hypothetical protein